MQSAIALRAFLLVALLAGCAAAPPPHAPDAGPHTSGPHSRSIASRNGPVGPNSGLADHEAVAFQVTRPNGPPLVEPARSLHDLVTTPTGAKGGEPTVRSTGNALLLTGGTDVLRSTDGSNWTVVQQHPSSADAVMGWDSRLHQAVKVDLEPGLACAFVSTSSADGVTWKDQPAACS